MSSLNTLVETFSFSNYENPAFLLIHGGPGMDCSYFRSSFTNFGHAASVYSYTQAVCENILTTRDLVEELREVVLSIKHKGIVLVGHSYGAALCLEYIKAYASDLQISSVLLMAGVVDGSWHTAFENKFNGTDVHRHVLALDEKVETKDANEAYRIMTLNWAPFYFTEPYREKGQRILGSMKFNARVSEWSWANYMKTFDLRDTIRSSPVPIGSLYGEQDDIVVSEYSKMVATLIHKQLVFNLESVGHFPFIEDMASVKKAMLKFVTLVGGS